MTTLEQAWAPTAQVAPDFVWYHVGGAPFTGLAYNVNNVAYPPVTNVYYTAGPNGPDSGRYQAYATPVGQTIVFDAVNSVGWSLPGYGYTIIPTGVSVVSYTWDFGNGQTAVGNLAATSYTTAGPDVVTTLTTVDTLGRVRIVSHPMNLQGISQPGGSIKVGQRAYP